MATPSFAVADDSPGDNVVETAPPVDDTAFPTESPEPTPRAATPAPKPVSATATVPAGTRSVRWGDLYPDATGPDAASLADLEVTVSQTEQLTNQGIEISWRNARPTSLGEFATDYLQIMQCWGDDPSGPLPTQCQWGAPTSSITTLIGLRTGSRDLVRNEDPAQVYDATVRIPPPPDNPFANVFRVPFQAVDGTRTFAPGDFFDSTTSNEVTAVRTGADRTGSVLFEVQTALEAPHLGCGASNEGSPRSCWLVIVPRGTFNLNGQNATTASAAGRILGSPLSATAWAQRIAIPLGFQPLTRSCALGSEERRVAGAETISAAITRWQPALCDGGTTFGFSMIGDGEARRLIVRDDPTASKLAFVTSVFPEEERQGATIKYAPVAQSAIVVAYNIDYALNSESAIAARNGTRVGELVLNARLVAKLLTQSYRNDIPDGGVIGGVTNNPVSIVKDPEFLRLNPDFRDFGINAFPPGLVVALGGSDANALVWQWLRADPLARGFLAGVADEWGMRIHSAYDALDLDVTPTDTFPKADLSTLQEDPAPPPGFGTLDMRPYAADYQEAALRALRGESGARTAWDPTRLPPSYVSTGVQRPGARFMIAIVDAPSAARFGLRTAKLVNAAGQAVAPTAESISATIASATPDAATGVRTIDPSLVKGGTYPLSVPIYAAVNYCGADTAALADYKKLLDYAVGAGQVAGDASGQLPDGYVPLPAVDVDAAKAVTASFATASTTCAIPTSPAIEEPNFDDFGEDFGSGGALPIDGPVPTAFPEVETVRAVASVPAGIGPVGFAAALALGVPSMFAGAILSRRARRLLDDEEALFD
ncbi:hypothetical protein [Microcella sp.]|uniref:hypothetical protein n=1 Tax=Microcella sp. TaxID=1913979 RepID=UPI00391CD1CE